MKEAIEINWRMAGAKLARLNDGDQAQFFDGFCYELETFDTELQKNMQMLSIRGSVKELTKKTMKNYFSAMWED